MANVTVTLNTSNVTVDEATSIVTVSSTASNVIVGELGLASNSEIRSALSVTNTGGDGSLAYDNTSGVFTYTGSSDADKNTWLATRTTDNLTEGTNLYYTQGRFDSAFTAKSTTDLSEGTNLYWTTARGNAQTLAYTGSLPNLTGDVITTADITSNKLLLENSSSYGKAEIGFIGNSSVQINVDRSATPVGGYINI